METESTPLQSKLKAWRRHLHKYPEMGFKEHRTSEYIADALREMGIEVHSGIGGTGIVGNLRFGSGAPVIALRAELDALPVTESASCRAHISLLPGTMHACGHDGHMAMVLGAANLLKQREDLNGTVRLIFQPDEEAGNGAKAMIDNGLLEQFPIDEIYAVHNMPGLPAGQICTKTGGIMAGEDQFRIVLRGEQSHAASPHTGIDTIVCGAHLVVALQTIVSRNVDPIEHAVLSCTRIFSEGANNIISGCTTIEGTVRTFKPQVRELIRARIEKLSDHVAASQGCTCEVDYTQIVAPTINTDNLVSDAVEAASEVIGDRAHRCAKELMTSEDFGVFLQHIPGNFAFIGNGASRDRGGIPLHNSAYDFNDDILSVGAKYFEALVVRRLRAINARVQ
jgi:amidohydrolase